MRRISEAFVNLELGIVAKKHGRLHQDHQVRSQRDERGGLTLLCIDCFELITFYVTQTGPENDGLPELRAAYFRGGATKDVPAWWYFAGAEQAKVGQAEAERAKVERAVRWFEAQAENDWTAEQIEKLRQADRDEIALLRQQRDELVRACKDLIIEVEDGVFAANIPSTIWATFDDIIKPLLANIKDTESEWGDP